jgi:long-chain acyl-CoA synthetase
MKNALEMFFSWEKENPGKPFLRQPFSDEWRVWSYAQAGDEIRKIASGIASLNLPRRTPIALLSKNCAHWIMADLAILMSGNISVPLYPTLAADSLAQILNHSDARAIIVGKLDHYETQQPGIPDGVTRIGISAYQVRESITWEGWLDSQQPMASLPDWDPNEVMTVKYTSGTTGGLKGVMHSFAAFEAVSAVTRADLQLPMHPRLFSYLPLSHIAERMGIEMFGLYAGGEFSFAESLDQFPKNLMETQPDLFFAVPRIWAKFQEKILEKIPQRLLNVLLGIPVVNSLLKKSIRKKMGLAKASHIYSGAAPISVALLRWFEKLGIIIFQAIGMTEDCVYSHFNRHGANRLGTVGQRLSGLQVKISAEGELRLKSPSLMKGYYKDPVLTAAAFDEEGFLKTGDLAEIDADGFLSITGRIKDQFKTDKGKYISPTPIETRLLTDRTLEHVCVVGTGIPQPIALVLLSAAGKSRSKEESTRELCQLVGVVNKDLQNHEKLEKIVILKDDWTIENGLITPTLKVKRNEVEKIHRKHYPQWYARKEMIIWE